ncbi:hypothetical protein SETIT_5G237400v2 [Setaria italica]|uniref:Uncharacterized protein n=2 Tax=Setaria TaxID=4554 RepID=A0A368R803_SETIT|nr:hypothetical protein SETIT_5G237400v2 [Setaria italica]TKW15552.1 hypothetical protein SEVIR_5G245000v2 [Setaria viridis]
MIGLIVLTSSFDLAPHILSPGVNRTQISAPLRICWSCGGHGCMARLGSSSACHIVILPPINPVGLSKKVRIDPPMLCAGAWVSTKSNRHCQYQFISGRIRDPCTSTVPSSTPCNGLCTYVLLILSCSTLPSALHPF